MLLWDQLYCCFCNIEPNEKQLFLQGNALVGGINYVFVLAASNLMKNNGFCTVMLLWDQLRLCYCSIKPNEKHWFLHGNAVVGLIISLFLQHST
jgi:hypothetical protein